MHAVVMAGGVFQSTPYLRGLISTADLLIGADAGSATLLELGFCPHIAVGDFDSLEASVFGELCARDCQIIRHSADKDESDTELALLVALERGADEIAILGALDGPRLDHLLANVMLLALPQLAEVRARLVDDNNEVLLLRNRVAIEGKVGDIVSVLPIGGDAVGVSTTGLQWVLTNSTLRFGAARGLSNIMIAPTASVEVASGMALVVHLLDSSELEADYEQNC